MYSTSKITSWLRQVSSIDFEQTLICIPWSDSIMHGQLPAQQIRKDGKMLESSECLISNKNAVRR